MEKPDGRYKTEWGKEKKRNTFVICQEILQYVPAAHTCSSVSSMSDSSSTGSTTAIISASRLANENTMKAWRNVVPVYLDCPALSQREAVAKSPGFLWGLRKTVTQHTTWLSADGNDDGPDLGQASRGSAYFSPSFRTYCSFFSAGGGGGAVFKTPMCSTFPPKRLPHKSLENTPLSRNEAI